MSSTEDAYSPFDPIVAGRSRASPWDAEGRYQPDLELLGQLLAVPLLGGYGQESGRFAKAIDAWIAHELRRAGFAEDEVWPRATRPRVLPRDLAYLLRLLPKTLRPQIEKFLLGTRGRRLAPVEARVLGKLYTKQVDVLIASWDRGAELIVSTKSILSSFWNNLRWGYPLNSTSPYILWSRFGSPWAVRKLAAMVA
jgi:hypothetical protein